MPKPKDEQSPNDALEQTPDQPLEQSLEQSLETTLEVLDEKGLEKWLVDSEYCEALVLWLAEELHVPRSAARIVMRQLAKLCINRGKKFGGWLGRKATNKVNKFILGLPYAKDILYFLHIHAGRAEAAIEAKREARKLFASGKEFVELLPLDVAGQVKILEELEDIDARIMAGFDAILDRLDIQPNLDCFELADPKRVATSIQRFKFNYRFMPLRGREAELELLREFLYHPSQGAGAPLSWFLLLGPGGAGKSRLALEFCLRNSPWRPGFLSYRQMEQFNWDQWRPDQPTLMVIDYCSRDPERLRDMILALRRNRHLDAPVRVLLLERDLGFEPRSWYERFLGGQTESESLQSTSHAKPLQLPALADEDFKAIITQYRFPESPDLEASIEGSTDLDEHLQLFKDMVKEGKDLPLFAALYGDVVGRRDAGDPGAPMSNAEELIEDVLNHEERTWGKQLGLTEKEWNGDAWREKREKDFALLALATMTGGVSHKQWRELPEKYFSKDSDTLRRMSVYTGQVCGPAKCCKEMKCDKQGTDCYSRIFPIQPDMLGDMFALRFFVKIQFGNDEISDTIRDISWETSPQWMITFLLRITSSYTSALINQRLYLPPTSCSLDATTYWIKCANILIAINVLNGNTSRAIELHSHMVSAVNISNNIEFRIQLSISLMSVILAHCEDNNIGDAILYYKNLRELLRSNPCDLFIQKQLAESLSIILEYCEKHNSDVCVSNIYTDLELLDFHNKDGQHLRRAIINAINRFAFLLLHVGNYNLAIVLYNKTLELVSHFPFENDLHILLASFLERTIQESCTNTSNAYSRWKRLLHLHNLHSDSGIILPKLLNNAARITSLAGKQGNLDCCLKIYRHIESIDQQAIAKQDSYTDFACIIYNIIITCCKKNKIEKALPFFTKLLSISRSMYTDQEILKATIAAATVLAPALIKEKCTITASNIFINIKQLIKIEICSEEILASYLEMLQNILGALTHNINPRLIAIIDQNLWTIYITRKKDIAICQSITKPLSLIIVLWCLMGNFQQAENIFHILEIIVDTTDIEDSKADRDFAGFFLCSIHKAKKSTQKAKRYAKYAEHFFSTHPDAPPLPSLLSLES